MTAVARLVSALLVAALVWVLAVRCAADDDAAVLAEARKGVVTICGMQGAPKKGGTATFFQEEAVGGDILGSGIVLSGDGLVLTANHTIAGVDKLSVVLWDLSEFQAQVLAVEPSLDIALLQIQSIDLVPLLWRADRPPVVGETVYTIGTPAAFSNDPGPSTSRGVISALHRSLETSLEEREAPFLVDLLETDARLSPGESGGALIDAQGKLLGMCLAVYHPTGAIGGASFALGADQWLREGIDAMLKGERFPIGKLGIEVAPLPLESARRLGVPARQGVRASYVELGGSAYAAGISEADVITRIDGQQVRLVCQFRRIEMRLRPGSTAKLTVLRSGSPQPFVFEVEVASRSTGSTAKTRELEWRGMRLADIDDAMRREYSAPGRAGVIATDVTRTGRAYAAGLRKGDVILEVNNTLVNSLAAFEEAVKGIPDSNVVRVRTTDGIGHIQGETHP